MEGSGCECLPSNSSDSGSTTNSPLTTDDQRLFLPPIYQFQILEEVFSLCHSGMAFPSPGFRYINALVSVALQQEL